MDLNAIIQSHVDLNAIIQSHVDLNAIIQSHVDLNAIIQSHVDLNAIIQSHMDLNAIIQSHMDLNAIIQSLKCFLTCSPIILNISFPIMYLLNDLYIHDLNCTMFIMKFAYLRWQGLHLCIYFVSMVYDIFLCL